MIGLKEKCIQNRKKGNILKFAGIWGEETGKKIEDLIKKERKPAEVEEKSRTAGISSMVKAGALNKGKSLGMFDCLIASSAITNEEKLITKGLKIDL